jgi:hypothetical protein
MQRGEKTYRLGSARKVSPRQMKWRLPPSFTVVKISGYKVGIVRIDPERDVH